MNSHETLSQLLPLQDAIEIIRGKWKMPIIMALLLGDRRYKELNIIVTGISSKVLSKELQELEENRLIEKKIIDPRLSLFKYGLTDHGRSLEPLIGEIAKWGKIHREVILFN